MFLYQFLERHQDTHILPERMCFWETPCLTETVCGIGRSWVRLVDWVWQPRRWIRGPGHPELATEELPRLRPVESGITPTFFTVCLWDTY